MDQLIKELCPKCNKEHQRGEYERWSRPNQPDVMSPPDIQCDCGLLLRWSVPIFKMTPSGYVLRPVRDDETPYIK